MWPWDISKLPPEDRARLRRAIQDSGVARAVYVRAAVVIYITIVILMFSVLTTAHDPTLRTVIMFAMIAVGFVIFFRNPMKDRLDARSSSIQDDISHDLMHPDAGAQTTPATGMPTLPTENLPKMPVQEDTPILTWAAAVAICIAIAMGTAALWINSFGPLHH